MATLIALFSLFITTKSQSNITTVFQCDESWETTAGGDMFDLENIGSEPLHIEQFAVHINTLTSQTITIYTKNGTYIGYDNDATAWTQIYSESVIGAGTGNPTQLTPLTTALTIQPGCVQAFFIYSSQYMCDTTGTTVGDVYVNDGNIAIETGIAIGCFGCHIYSPYVWNGIIYYSLPTPAPTEQPAKFPIKTPTISPTTNPFILTVIPSATPTYTKYPTHPTTVSPTTHTPTEVTVLTVSPTPMPSKTVTKSSSSFPTTTTRTINLRITNITTKNEEQETDSVISIKSKHVPIIIFILSLACMALCCIIIAFIIGCFCISCERKLEVVPNSSNNPPSIDIHNTIHANGKLAQPQIIMSPTLPSLPKEQPDDNELIILSYGDSTLGSSMYKEGKIALTNNPSNSEALYVQHNVTSYRHNAKTDLPFDDNKSLTIKPIDETLEDV